MLFRIIVIKRNTGDRIVHKALAFNLSEPLHILALLIVIYTLTIVNTIYLKVSCTIFANYNIYH